MRIQYRFNNFFATVYVCPNNFQGNSIPSGCTAASSIEKLHLLRPELIRTNAHIPSESLLWYDPENWHRNSRHGPLSIRLPSVVFLLHCHKRLLYFTCYQAIIWWHLSYWSLMAVRLCPFVRNLYSIIGVPKSEKFDIYICNGLISCVPEWKIFVIFPKKGDVKVWYLLGSE